MAPWPRRRSRADESVGTFGLFVKRSYATQFSSGDEQSSRTFVLVADDVSVRIEVCDPVQAVLPQFEALESGAAVTVAIDAVEVAGLQAFDDHGEIAMAQIAALTEDHGETLMGSAPPLFVARSVLYPGAMWYLDLPLVGFTSFGVLVGDARPCDGNRSAVPVGGNVETDAQAVAEIGAPKSVDLLVGVVIFDVRWDSKIPGWNFSFPCKNEAEAVLILRICHPPRQVIVGGKLDRIQGNMSREGRVCIPLGQLADHLDERGHRHFGRPAVCGGTERKLVEEDNSRNWNSSES
jgi:hypothetical protein